MQVVQITDCHIVRDGELMADRVDPELGLRSVIAAVNALDPLPDLVVGTGDLVNSGAAAEYDRLEYLLDGLISPFLPLPGNHDDRGELRRRFEVLPSGVAGEPIDHVVDVCGAGSEVRLVCLDTTIPGSHAGHLTVAQCTWLHNVLTERPDTPTVVFQHHPPFPSGIPSMDRDCGFSGAHLESAVIARHDHVQLISCGHYHRSITRRFAGTVAACWPSTAVQLQFDQHDAPTRYRSDPVGFTLHHVDTDGFVASHFMPVVDAEVWTPSWVI